MIKYYCKHYQLKFNEFYFESFIDRYIYNIFFIQNNKQVLKSFIYFQRQIEKTILQFILNKRLIYIYCNLMYITRIKNSKCIDIVINYINTLIDIRDKQALLNCLFKKGLLNINQCIEIQKIQEKINAQILLNDLMSI